MSIVGMAGKEWWDMYIHSRGSSDRMPFVRCMVHVCTCKLRLIEWFEPSML